MTQSGVETVRNQKTILGQSRAGTAIFALQKASRATTIAPRRRLYAALEKESELADSITQTPERI